MTLQDIPDGGPPGRLLRQVIDLQAFYGLIPSPPTDPFALFVWETLARKSTPAGRDAALAALRRAHVLTPDAVLRAPRATLEAAVAPAGSSVDLRLDALRAGAEVFRRHPALPDAIRGSLAVARRWLRLLPQLDPAAAHRMLLFAGNHPVMPADARVQRVVLRLGYAAPPPASARRVRRAVAFELRGDLDACRRAFVYLSHHASQTCTEREPHCRVCPLVGECPWALHNDVASGFSRT
jgi:endonuclease III